MDRDALAFNLRRHRKARGWTQQRVADSAGLSKTTISRLENSQVSSETESYLPALARIFGLTAEELSNWQPALRSRMDRLDHPSLTGPGRQPTMEEPSDAAWGRRVPIYDVANAEDARRMVADADQQVQVDIIGLPPEQFRHRESRACLVRARGVWGAPLLRDGDTLVIELIAWRSHDRVLALVDDELYIGRIERRNGQGWVLIAPDDGPAIPVDDRVDVIGVVRARVLWEE